MAKSVAEQVADMLELAVGKLGTPYIWWAKGEEYGVVRGKFEKRPTAPLLVAGGYGELAFDCSGFVTWLFKQVGGEDLRWTHNTDKLWVDSPEVSLGEVQPGDLAFYGGSKPDDVSHVMLVLSVIRGLDAEVTQVVVIGASGGGSSTTTPKPAACVKVCPTHLYRRDFRGFRGGLLRYPF